MTAVFLALLASATVQIGEWRIEIRTTVDPPVEGNASEPPTERLVVTSTPDLLQLVRTQFFDPGCRLDDYRDTGGRITAKPVCRDAAGRHILWKLDGRYSPFEVSATTTTQAGQQVITRTIDARFLASGTAFPDTSVSWRDVILSNDVWMTIGADERLKLRLIEDDRCPRQMMCEWAGAARAALEYRGARGFVRDGHLAFPAQPGLPPTALCAGSLRIELTEVAPWPQHRVTVEAGTYRFTVRLGQCGGAMR